MIAGIGFDIVEISRLESAIAKHPKTFVNHVYTRNEQATADGKKNKIQFYAGRWAAKEAFVKALGIGIGQQCKWVDIEITNDDLGQPMIALSGDGATTLKSRKITHIHVSISHEKNVAGAVVVLERTSSQISHQA